MNNSAAFQELLLCWMLLNKRTAAARRHRARANDALNSDNIDTAQRAQTPLFMRLDACSSYRKFDGVAA